MKQTLIATLVTVVLFAGCSVDPLISEEETIDQRLVSEILRSTSLSHIGQMAFPNPLDYNQIPQDPLNQLTREKVDLGRLLYHETSFSTDNLFQETENTYSCATCHFAEAGFQAGILQGLGEGGLGFGSAGEGRFPAKHLLPSKLDVQPLRTPSSMNLAYQVNLLWNGQFGAGGQNSDTYDQWDNVPPTQLNYLGFEGLETQAIAGIKVHRMNFSQDKVTNSPYQQMFDEAFYDWDESVRYSDTTAGLAIAAYERTLLAYDAPFQRWLRGDYAAMSDEEKEGALLFFGKANCSDCHSSPALSGDGFEAIGLNDFIEGEVFFLLPEGEAFKGRASFTKREEDLYKFKIPQLYNLKDSPFYGHGGSFTDIRELIEYKNRGQAENPIVSEEQLSPFFVSLLCTRK